MAAVLQCCYCRGQSSDGILNPQDWLHCPWVWVQRQFSPAQPSPDQPGQYCIIPNPHLLLRPPAAPPRPAPGLAALPKVGSSVGSVQLRLVWAALHNTDPHLLVCPTIPLLPLLLNPPPHKKKTAWREPRPSERNLLSEFP